MATRIKAKITSATQEGQKSVIEIQLSDAKGSWTKRYEYRQINTIKLNQLKERVEAEVRKDLAKNDPLAEVKSEVGKEFTITV